MRSANVHPGIEADPLTRTHLNRVLKTAILGGFLSAAACLPKTDKDDSAGARDSWSWSEQVDTGPRVVDEWVGDGTGEYGLLIQDVCTAVWVLDGVYTGTGSDYTWDVTLTADPERTIGCPAIDNSGALVVIGGNAYLNGSYIGVATYSGESILWQTAGYVTGVGGGAYAYEGFISW